MRRDVDRALVYIVYALAVAVFVYAVAVSGKKTSWINGRLNEAVVESEYRHSEYVVYDKTIDDATVDAADRLIDVRPFGWSLLNADGKLYVLSPERSTNCGSDGTPVVQILKTDFYDACLNVTVGELNATYRPDSGAKNSSVVRVPYDLTGVRTFTILSAINDLSARGLLDYDAYADRGEFGSRVRRPKRSVDEQIPARNRTEPYIEYRESYDDAETEQRLARIFGYEEQTRKLFASILERPVLKKSSDYSTPTNTSDGHASREQNVSEHRSLQ